MPWLPLRLRSGPLELTGRSEFPVKERWPVRGKKTSCILCSTLAVTFSCMRLFTFFVFLAIPCLLNGQTPDSILKVKFDKVIIYDYEGGRTENPIVNNKQQLATSIKKQVELSKPTIDSLDKNLVNKKMYGNITAMCVDPHLGIVYYLEDKIVAHISVCLNCNVLHSSFEIAAQKQSGETGADGLSKSFRQFLNDLLKRYGFSHQIKAGSSFDK